MVDDRPRPKIESGTPEAANHSPEVLLKAYQPLVRAIAGRLHGSLPCWVELDDLIQLGQMGLLQAIERYRQDRNVTFPTYAKFRIRGAMIDGLRELDWASREIRAETRHRATVRFQLEIANERPATEAELAEALGMTLDQFRGRQRHTPPTLVSLSVWPKGEPEPEWNIADEQPNPFDAAMEAEVRDRVSGALQQLSERERFVLHSYYWESRTLAEIADAIGVNESRVCQLRKHAIARVRDYLQRIGIWDTAGHQRPTDNRFGEKGHSL